MMTYWQTYEPVNLDDFESTGDYNARELEAYADALLKKDIKENGNVQHILFKEHLEARGRREMKVDATKIDESITNALPKNDRAKAGVHVGDGQMMYNRTHPKGRKVNSQEQRRKHGASFFR